VQVATGNSESLYFLGQIFHGTDLLPSGHAGSRTILPLNRRAHCGDAVV
jgi:hypothetical protein